MKNSLVLFFLLTASFLSLAENNYKWGLGAGLGANYAFNPGINISYRANKIEFIGALGLQDHYTLGVIYNFRDQNPRWQPRLGVNYGTNGDLRVYYNNSDVEELGYPDTYQGISFLIGNRIGFGHKRHHGLEIDLSFRVTDGGFSDDQKKFDVEEERQSASGSGAPNFSWIGNVFGGYTNVQLSIGWKMYY